MKKILLATALAAVSISAVEAKWDGFYSRGSLAVRLNGETNMKGNDLLEGNRCYFGILLDVAGGWGATVANNSIYLGVDAQLGNIKIALDNPTRDAGAIWTFTYRPVLHGRIGLPLNNVMPYVAGGVGYMTTTTLGSSKKLVDLPKGMSISARLGVDVKVDDNWFVGGYFQFEHCTIVDSQQRYLDANEVVTGFSVGYQF